MNPLEILDIAGDHGEQIIVAARHQQAAHYRRAFDDGAFECKQRVLALAVECDSNDDGGAEPERLQAEDGLISFDQPILLERGKATGTSGR